jgi:hypothetical protein
MVNGEWSIVNDFGRKLQMNYPLSINNLSIRFAPPKYESSLLHRQIAGI